MAIDLKVIEQKQMVERYLLGRLPPPEARFFEQLVRRSPELAERMGLPEALKRTMRLLDETGTEWREQAPRFWHKPGVPLALVAALLLAAGLALTFWSGQRVSQARYVALRHAAEQGLLAAPVRAQVLRLPVDRPEARAQTYLIGGRATPTLAELHLAIGFAAGVAYAVTIKRDDGTYWGRLENLLRDSNGELRLTLNSAIFPAGLYEVEIESLSLRGERHPAGHLRLRIDAG